MASSIHRDVFKIESDHSAVRFGAKFVEADGPEEKWSGTIPEIPEMNKSQLIGSVITNSEGKEYKLNRFSEGNSGEDFDHHPYFWIESV
jgi:hypothetical protein